VPATRLIFFCELNGRSAVVEWLEDLRRESEKAWANCRAQLERLAALGHELRRPAADFLRDGIYELRAKSGRVQYRLLYFFHGRNVAVVAHALTKEDKVPPIDIERALKRKAAFQSNPEAHTYEEDSE
jgi:phage-related protein